MAKKICTNCGSQRRPKLVSKGLLTNELLLWTLGLATSLYFSIILFAAIAYSFYRAFASASIVCRECGSPNMVPIDSPRGKVIIDNQ